MPKLGGALISRATYNHLIAASCFCIQAVGIGVYITYGVFFNPLMSEFGWSRAAISGASSLAFFTMGLFGILVGRFNDRFGPRRLMAGTAVILGLGCILMSKLTAVWQLYLFYGIIFGIGLSSTDVIALSTVARWFPLNRGMMTGIVKVGTGAGQFTIPLLASFLIAGYGWRNAYIAIGAGAIVVLLAISLILRRDPAGMDESTGRTKHGRTPQPTRPITDLTFGQACRTLQLWIICLANLTLLFCLMTVMLHIVPHARDTGASPSIAAGVLATIGGVSMLGRFVTGIAIDRVGSKRIMIICFFMLIAGLFWLLVADEPWMLYLFAAAYGLAHGGLFTTISPLVAEWFGIVAHGAVFGTVAFFGTVGGAIGPIVNGYIFDITGSYRPAFWLITAMAAVGLALILSLKPIRGESNG